MQSTETRTEEFTQKSTGKSPELTKILWRPPTPGKKTLRDACLIEKLFCARGTMRPYRPTCGLDYYDTYAILFAGYNKLESKLPYVLHCTLPIALDDTLPAAVTYAF